MKLSKRSDGQLTSALKVLGEPNRLRILCGLGLECRPVTDIIRATGLAQTNVSFHLRVLREVGFVRAERRGAFVYYCLTDVELLHILRDLTRWLEARQAASTRATANRRGRPAKTRASLTARARKVA